MIIQFSFANFRSISKIQTISLVAAPPESVAIGDENTVIQAAPDLRLLPSAVIYGANAAGKSNFFKALEVFKFVAIRSQARLEVDAGIPLIEPFLLSTETENAPTFFEIVFLAGKRRYRYGLEATAEAVVSEWLFEQKATREDKLFTRELQDIYVNKAAFKEGLGLDKNTRSNASFLSVCAALQGPTASAIVRWFQKLNSISGLKDRTYLRYTVGCLIRNHNEQEINQLLSQLDVNLERLTLEFPEGRPKVGQRAKVKVNLIDEREEISGADSPDAINGPAVPVAITTPQPKRDDAGRVVGDAELELAAHASQGTQKLFAIAGPIVDTLKNGKILCVDELDARLHPIVSAALVRLFNSSTTNPKNAQLIFATHDVNLLSLESFRRDQIWFAEKDERGATHFYSLATFRFNNEIDGKQRSIEKDYIRGKFGAIPFLGDLSSIFAGENEGMPSVEVNNGEAP